LSREFRGLRLARDPRLVGEEGRINPVITVCVRPSRVFLRKDASQWAKRARDRICQLSPTICSPSVIALAARPVVRFAS